MHISRSKYLLVRGIIVCSVLLLVLGIIRILFDMTFQQFMANRYAEIHSAANLVNTYFNDNLAELKLLARGIDLTDTAPTEVELKLQEIFKLGFFNASIFDDKENLVANVLSSDARTEKIEDRIGFEQALRGHEHISDVFFDATMDRSYMIINVPVLDMRGSVTGVLVAKMDIKKFNAILSGLYDGSSEYFFVLDSENSYLHNLKERTVQLQVENSEDIEKTLFLQTDYIRLHQRLEHSSWCIDAVIPTKAFYKSIAYALLMPLILLILCAIIIILTIWFIYKDRGHQKAYAMMRIESLTTATQVAAGIAHEIKNPLASLKGFIQLMSKQDHEHSQTNYLTIMQDEIDRIDCLTNQFCMLSKPLDKVEYKTFNLLELMCKVIFLFEQQALQKSIDLTMLPLEANYEQFLIQGNTNQLKQVLINLIRNAIEATGEHGKVTMLCRKHKGNIVVTIQDNGSGISSSDLENLGTPFYTTKENGTGLGLLVSFEIIRKHGGKINIDSCLGVGTTLQIILPEAKNNRLSEGAIQK
ncbi:MAG: sasA 6 [Massilibacillus sp.]|nr:sasA 6 [Massilibacillus sp.]